MPGTPFSPPAATGSPLLDRLLAAPGRRDRLTHVAIRPARAGQTVPWPAWVPADLVAALRDAGVPAPWAHQVEVAQLARSGRHVIVATGTASGKSLAYLLPTLTAVAEGATALYVAPTKALAADQLRAVTDLGLVAVRAASYDGDTPAGEREWARRHAGYLLTNPDMLHHGVLPAHRRWAPFLRRLRYVVIDECHVYRGVFGSHVAGVLRRLRRICAQYGADPTFVLASATVSEPAASATRLTGLPVAAVVDDASPAGRTVLALWEPPLADSVADGPGEPADDGYGAGMGERGATVRRSATAESADLVADLVTAGAATLAFVRSRRGAEALALNVQRLLGEVDPVLSTRVAAYRAGFLPEERRELEAALRTGRLLALATTNALELGVDVTGLDAVVLAGYPGTRTATWQQVGRAGRAGQEALGVLVARADPLDTYLVHHPASLLDAPVEATVLDPDNPYVLTGQLAAAAAELPLTAADLVTFGPAARPVVDQLVAARLLRARPGGWYWCGRSRATDLADLRGTGGPPVQVVEGATGRLLGTVDAAAAHTTVHTGAVYLHQGESYLVDHLDLAASVAMVHPVKVDWTTTARTVSDIAIVATERTRPWGATTLSFGVVDVTSQVVSYQRRRILSGQVLDECPLDLPPVTLRTAAVWWTVPDEVLVTAGLDPSAVPGAAHAAEHAAIGLLPLVATCDRWDIGGLSTAAHPDTGMATVFVHDGIPGGAGFAERGYDAAATWLRATRDAVASCGCLDGCPSCVQSPKCGNGNEPLDKAGAVRLLDATLAAAPRPVAGPDSTVTGA